MAQAGGSRIGLRTRTHCHNMHFLTQRVLVTPFPKNYAKLTPGILSERESSLPEETVYRSPAWDCGKGSLV